jgi:hypothetical protein
VNPALPENSGLPAAAVGLLSPNYLDASVAQLVEHHVANVNVEGSNPFARSIFFATVFPLLRQHMRRIYHAAEGTGWGFANFADVIDTTLRTGWNLSRAVQLDVRFQVVWKMDGVSIG